MPLYFVQVHSRLYTSERDGDAFVTGCVLPYKEPGLGAGFREGALEYGYGFDDDDSPRFTLNSLWFLLGVMVFAFTVLIMAAIVTGGADRSYYLNVGQQPARQQGKPAVANSPKTSGSSTTSSSSGATRPR